MKKNVFLVLGLLVLGITKAQDTIPFLDSCFAYPRPMSLYHLNAELPLDTFRNSRYSTYNSLGGDGINVWSYKYKTHSANTNFYGIVVTTDHIDLFKGVKGVLFTYNESTGYTYLDSIYSGRSFYKKRMFFDYNSSYNNSDIGCIVPCNIFLFDSVISIKDSVYYLRIENTNPVYSIYNIVYTNSISFASINNYMFYGNFGMMFPILQLPCPAPRTPNIGQNMSGRVDFLWRAGDTALYQLAFYSYPDSSLVFETDALSDTTFTLCDSIVPASMVDGSYMVRLRKACDYTASAFDTIVWSDWSEPRQFNYMHSTEGIAEMDEGAAFSLSPNPARGMVTVEVVSEFALQERATVLVVDMEGHMVKSAAVQSRSHDLDVSTLVPGVYLVRLGTPQGTAARKLVVE